MKVEPTILLLDAGIANTGIAVWSIKRKRFIYLQCIRTECLATKHNLYVADDNVRRCSELALGLRTIIGRFYPSVIFSEMPTGGAFSAKSAVGMAHALATVSATCAVLKKALYPIQPFETKKLVYGNAKRKVSKKEVQDLVLKKFGDMVVMPERILLSRYTHREHIADAMVLIEVVRTRYSNFLQIYETSG
jgi:Holliday junction resolvasome RuvABC endonuclease subunit